MWVRTTANDLVNIATARNVVIEPDYSYSPQEAMKIVANYNGGEQSILALIMERSRDYAEARANALYNSIVEGLRNQESFCDLLEQ